MKVKTNFEDLIFKQNQILTPHFLLVLIKYLKFQYFLIQNL